MRKKWLALALSLTMVAGCLTGCGGSDSTTSNTNSGSSSNDSANPDYDKSTKSIGDVKVNFIQNANEGNNYQDKLDAALKAQDSASADDKVDMFLCEMDYVNKYTNTDKALDVKALGLTDEMEFSVEYHGRVARVDSFTDVLMQNRSSEQTIRQRFRSS